MMNAEIETIFSGFAVDDVEIPVAFMFYDGDDDLLGYVTYYDFEIYAKGNYSKIITAVKALMKENGWTFQPAKSSTERYDRDTRVYSKTLCFAKPIQTNL